MKAKLEKIKAILGEQLLELESIADEVSQDGPAYIEIALDEAGPLLSACIDALEEAITPTNTVPV